MVDKLMRVVKKMYKASGAKKKDGMHRPEGAGNFDNMDDYNIVNSIDINEGTIQAHPLKALDIVNKKYVDDTNTTDHSTLNNLTWSTAGHTIDTALNMATFDITNATNMTATGVITGGDINTDDFNAADGTNIFDWNNALTSLDFQCKIDTQGSDISAGLGTMTAQTFTDTVMSCTGGLFTEATCEDPTADADLANKKYVDDNTGTTYTFSTGLTNTADTITTNDSEIVHNNLSGYEADEHIDWKDSTDDFKTTGKMTYDNIDKATIVKSLVSQAGDRLFYLDLTTFDMFSTATSGTGSTTQALAIATTKTGTTAGSYARQNINAQETYMSGVWSGRIYPYDITSNALKFVGISRTLYTTQATHVDLTIHAGFYYNNGQWYTSTGDGSTQELNAIALTLAPHVFRVEYVGSELLFYVDDVLVSTHDTIVPTTYGYFQWFVNNKALTSDERIAFYNLVYID